MRWLGLIFISLTVSCANQTKERLESRSVAASVPAVEGTHYAALQFDEGKATLSEENKRELNRLAQRATKDGREIEDIKILSWADKEYPQTTDKPSSKEVKLAKERAAKIKTYLEEDLHSQDDIMSFNMAKRPTAAAEVFKNDDWVLKEAFEKSGATGARLPDGSMSYTKASKALVIIDYKDNQNI